MLAMSSDVARRALHLAAAPPAFPTWVAASMGQRNTRLKCIGWSLESQRFARSLIQSQSDLVES
jgi:hypothetical protein